MDIIHLPHDLFLLIIAHLCPRDAICCRGVSRKWRHAFTNSELSLTLLRWHFPRCRELRLAASAASFRAAAAAGELGVPTTDELDVELQLELERAAGGDRDWAPVFAEVARRYHHLRTATPAATERIDIQKSQWRFFGVGTWNRYLRLDDKTAPFHYADPRWAYNQEDGVLVYQSVPPPEDDKLPGDGIMATGGKRPRNDAAAATHGYINDTDMYGHPFRLLDLATRQEYRVPFHSSNKIVRRVRLADGVLIFEWCEELPYHDLNDREAVHRHYTTAFDVIRERSVPDDVSEQVSSSSTSQPTGTIKAKDKTWHLPNGKQESARPDTLPPPWTWKITFRSEWKMHFLGLPLNRTDRFFSAHTSTHYALYVWQPNRSPWGEDDPIELLTIWDISSPSSYKPSEDPSGRQRPDDLILNISLSGIHPQPAPVPANNAKDAGCGPRLIRRMTWRDLEFYGIRQRTTPKLRGLSLDCYNVYIVEEEHRWAQGQHSSLSPPRVHQVKSTAIPVIPGPPRGVAERSSPPSPDKAEFAPEQEDDDAEEPATRLHPLSQPQRAPAATDSDDGATATSSLSAASVAGSAHSNHINGVHHRPLPPPVEGPRWVDECGADGDVNMSFCWRAQVLSTARTPDGMAATAIPLVREQSLWSRSRGAQRCNDATFTAPFAATAAAAAAAAPSTLTNPGIWGGSTSLPASGSASRTRARARARASVETESAVRASPSRWPGWAPCWRHEDFPYLTVSEMVDFGAGVRVTARHCFMLETLSVHVRPAICVKGVVGGGEGEGDDDDDDNDKDGGEEISANPVERLAKLRGRMMAQLHRSRASGSAPADQDGRDKRPLGKGGPRGQEVQFADEMWDELLGKGFICGDERWIIGEDKDGRITIVRF